MVLIRNRLSSIHNIKHVVRPLHERYRPPDPFAFNLALRVAQTRCVGYPNRDSVDDHRLLNDIACRARSIGYYGAAYAKHGIEERGFPHIRAPKYGHNGPLTQ